MVIKTKLDLNLDWDLLRDQKECLLNVIDRLADRKATDMEKEEANCLNGIIHMVDDIQDQAAEIIGEEAVFGKD